MSEFEPLLLAFFLIIDFEVLIVKLFRKEFGELIFRVWKWDPTALILSDPE
jgi:hypothetical protein